MSELMIKDEEKSIIANIVLNGDLSGLKPEEKVKYYNMFCDSLGLNPVTKPFDIITLNNKQVLYAKKDCAEQLRKINGVSVIELKKTFESGIYIVECKVQDKTGKIDISTGAVSILNLKGDMLANAIMKAETKAKRRATLSICGLGILDETELETIPEFKDISSNIELKDEIKNNIKNSSVNYTSNGIVEEKKVIINNSVTTPKKDAVIKIAGALLLKLSNLEIAPFKKELKYYTEMKNNTDEISEEKYQEELIRLELLKTAIEANKKLKTGAINDTDPPEVQFKEPNQPPVDKLPKGVL